MGGGGGGSLIDPSYEDALRIMGRAHILPSPFEQRALLMEDADAAELARRLTALRRTAGVGLAPFAAPPTLGAPDGASLPDQPVQALIAALQEAPPDRHKLAALRQQIEQAGADVQAALDRVCQHPAVQSKLEGESGSEDLLESS